MKKENVLTFKNLDLDDVFFKKKSRSLLAFQAGQTCVKTSVCVPTPSHTKSPLKCPFPNNLIWIISDNLKDGKI